MDWIQVMKKFDGDLQLGDLRALLALVAAGTVTKASEALGLSPSAPSHPPERMRRQFGDPLFVRVGNRMAPTPRVESLLLPAAQVLRIVDTEIKGHTAFEPASSDRVFKISVNEIGAIALVPRLLRQLAVVAPHTRLTQKQMDPQSLSADLESGALDLAAGYLDTVNHGLVGRLLYRRDYVCIASARHPRIRASMGWKQLREEVHLQNPGIARVNDWIRDLIAERGHAMAPPMLTHHVAAMPFLVADSDLIAFVPREVFELFRPIADIKCVTIPIKLPTIEIHQYWHPRLNGDPGHKFFRDLVFEVVHP